METEGLLTNERKETALPAYAETDDKAIHCQVVIHASTSDTVNPTFNGNTNGSNTCAVHDGNDNPNTTKMRDQVRRCSAYLKKRTLLIVFCSALVVVILGAIILSVASPSPIVPVSSRKYENSTRSSRIFTSSICYNDAMRHACSGNSSITDSSMQLLCSFLTCSVSVDPMAASQGKDYEQLCKSIYRPGVKGMDYVCHTCLGYNSSDQTVSELIANECLFVPAILQRSYTHDGTSPWIALRSNDPERWLNSNYCLFTYATQLLNLASSTNLVNRSTMTSLDFVQPICKLERQCFDIINLHISDGGEGPPTECDPGEVLSWAANKSCISTKDWLGRWLNCCPQK